MRLTQFRGLMEDEFGTLRAGSLARDHVFAELGGQTVEQAIESGVDLRGVWRAVCEAYEVPTVAALSRPGPARRGPPGRAAGSRSARSGGRSACRRDISNVRSYSLLYTTCSGCPQTAIRPAELSV